MVAPLLVATVACLVGNSFKKVVSKICSYGSLQQTKKLQILCLFVLTMIFISLI